MSRIVQRVWSLIRAAVDSEAEEDDACADALTACTLITSEGLQIYDRFADPRAESGGERDPSAMLDGRVIQSRFAAPCRICKVRIEVGEPCWWSRGRGVTHYTCIEEAA